MSATPAINEQLIVIVHEHWVKYVRIILVYILLLTISLTLFFFASVAQSNDVWWFSQALLLAALLLFLINHHWFFMALFSQSENHIIVTDKRVIVIRGRMFFQEGLREYSFDKMKTVEGQKKGLLQNILQYGTLKFETGPDITYVPHPNTVVMQIEQAMGLT